MLMLNLIKKKSRTEALPSQHFFQHQLSGGWAECELEVVLRLSIALRESHCLDHLLPCNRKSYCLTAQSTESLSDSL